MRISILAIPLFALLGAASNGQAEEPDWAKAMFSETSHDFGVVAAGAKVEYKFVIENIYEEDAHIKSVQSSCGCTVAKIDRQSLKTWEKAELTAVVNTDTRQYYGRKDTTITINFDLPFEAEVQVHIHAYIRRDVVVLPGVVEFGSVSQGRDNGAKGIGKLCRSRRLADRADRKQQSLLGVPIGRGRPWRGEGEIQPCGGP